MSHIAETLWDARGVEAPESDNKLKTADLRSRSGVYPHQMISHLMGRKIIQTVSSMPFDSDQIQPASLDLRLGFKAHRIRASFLTGINHTVEDLLAQGTLHDFSLEKEAVLEKGCLYIIELEEFLDLPESVSAIANPKSSTGRLDVFTRLITDHSEAFDAVQSGYRGKLYAEISPRTFGIKVRRGSRLNQLRFRRRAGKQDRYSPAILSDKDLRDLHEKERLVDGLATIRQGLNVRLSLVPPEPSEIVGYRAQKHTDIIDIDRPNAYRIEDFWEPLRQPANGSLILDPGEFYILVSKEALHVPPHTAAEMVPIDPMMGEFRAHYAGFFDPGFGHDIAGGSGSRAVLEVRSHDVPFILRDGQIIARLIYEELTERPDIFYGKTIGSHYQAQGLKLSKHFC